MGSNFWKPQQEDWNRNYLEFSSYIIKIYFVFFLWASSKTFDPGKNKYKHSLCTLEAQFIDRFALTAVLLSEWVVQQIKNLSHLRSQDQLCFCSEVDESVFGCGSVEQVG